MSTGASSDFGRREYDDATVTYGVKELLSRIELQQAAAFAELKTKLDMKADKSDLARMEVRLDNHATRLHALESERDKNAERQSTHTTIAERTWSRRQRIWVAAVGLLGVLATFFGPYAATHI